MNLGSVDFKVCGFNPNTTLLLSWSRHITEYTPICFLLENWYYHIMYSIITQRSNTSFLKARGLFLFKKMENIGSMWLGTGHV